MDASPETLAEIEIRHIIKVMDHTMGDKTAAARILGISVKTMYNKLHEHGIFEYHRARPGKNIAGVDRRHSRSMENEN